MCCPCSRYCMGQSVTLCFEIIAEKDNFCYDWFLLNHPCNFKQTQGDECLWEIIKQNYVMKESIKVHHGAAGFNYRSQSREVIWASLPGCNIGFFSKVHVVTELRWWYFHLFFFPGRKVHILFLLFVFLCLPADDGKLSLDEFQAFFSDGTLNEEELEKLFNTIDSDNTRSATPLLLLCLSAAAWDGDVCRQKKKKKKSVLKFSLCFWQFGEKNVCIYFYIHTRVYTYVW